MTFDRQFYVPEGAVKVSDKNSDAVVYVYRNTDWPCAVGFYGRKSKPVFKSYFPDDARREEYVKKFFAGRQEATARKAKDRAARNGASTLKVGDILVASWGYEQTNVDFYEVVGTTGKRTVMTRKIASEMTDASSNMAGRCVAKPGQYIGETETHRVSSGSYVTIDDVRRARVWDGLPAYFSSYH